ncbi:MAG: hypothetical protein KME08_02500 [Aphanothece sp. CMT-3BRIN-NPC111]|nr:hypothetical protein [Aphanothece sp. CMT-3BRIN-NPC111]
MGQSSGMPTARYANDAAQIDKRSTQLTINIRDEGLRILALGTSATAQGGDVRPKRGMSLRVPLFF